MPSVEQTPALLGHCKAVYDTMFQRATRVFAEGEPMVLYEGKLTELITKDCNLSMPYYTSVTKALVAMACARQLRRGGGNSLSQWELIQEPTLELFQSMPAQMQSTAQKPAGDDPVTLQIMQNHGQRINRIEQALGLDKIPLPIRRKADEDA